MNRFRAVRGAMLVVAVFATGCQDSRVVNPAAASLFVPNIAGVWSGPMTLLATSGGECTGAVVPTFLPSNDEGTVTITEGDDALTATMTMESTGLACRYSGSKTNGVYLASQSFVTTDDYEQPLYKIRARILIIVPGQFIEAYGGHGEVVQETADFDRIWVGTETRDYADKRWGGDVQYKGYYLMRWLGVVGGAKCGVGRCANWGSSAPSAPYSMICFGVFEM